MSLKSISLQGCPQVTGQVVKTINSICGSLRYLNLSQCRHAQAAYLKEIFVHQRLCALNLSYIEGLGDEVFDFNMGGFAESSSNISTYSHQLQKIHLGKSSISDLSLIRMSTRFRDLVEVRFQWCSGVSDGGVVPLVQACPRLCVVDLKSSAITDVSLHAIASYCKDLKVLDVSWCSALTNEGFAAFATDNSADDRVDVGGRARTISSGDDVLFDDDDDFLSLLFANAGSRSIENMDSSSPLSSLKKRSEVGPSLSSVAVSGVSSSRLQKLMVVWCPLLTEEFLLLLQALPALRTIDAMGCAGISATAVDLFNSGGMAMVNV